MNWLGLSIHKSHYDFKTYFSEPVLSLKDKDTGKHNSVDLKIVNDCNFYSYCAQINVDFFVLLI